MCAILSKQGAEDPTDEDTRAGGLCPLEGVLLVLLGLECCVSCPSCVPCPCLSSELYYFGSEGLRWSADLFSLESAFLTNLVCKPQPETPWSVTSAHCCSSVTSVVSDSVLQPASLLCPRDSLGKVTREGCHPLLQGIGPGPGNLGLLSLPRQQASSLPPAPPVKSRLSWLYSIAL